MKCSPRSAALSRPSVSFVGGTLLITAWLTIFHPSQASAQVDLGPVAGALGGAGRAAVDPGEASWLNPAALSHLKQYYVGVQGELSDHAVDGHERQFSVLAADNEPGDQIAGSLTYVHTKITHSSGLNIYAQDLQAALSTFVFRQFSVGLTLHRLETQPSLGSNSVQYNGNVGLLWVPTPKLGIALVGYDLVPEGTSVAVGQRLISSVGLGANWVAADTLHVRLDIVRPSAYGYGRNDILAGFETYIDPQFALRFGTAMKDTVNETLLTAGFGILGPKLTVNYAYQRDLRQAEGSRHMVDLYLPF